MTLTVKESKQWKNWKLQQIAAEIKIYEGLLHVARTEYAWLNGVHDANLDLRFGCESEQDLAPFREEQATWTRQLEDIAVEGLLNGKAKEFLTRSAAA